MIKKVGILGGAFDPPHHGHIQPVLESIKHFDLDYALLVPYFASPSTHKQPVADPQQRLAMLQLAAKDIPQLSVSDIELKRQGTSYTVDTLQALHAAYDHGHEFYFMMGQDAFKTFARWKNPQKILELSHLIIHQRGDAFDRDDLINQLPFESREGFCYDPNRHCLWSDTLKHGIYYQTITPLPIASSQLRQQLNPDFLHPKVLDYIHKEKLYRN